MPRSGSSYLCSLAAAGAELSWLYALAAYLFILAGARPFPPLLAVAAFSLAFFCTSLTRRRGLRVGAVLALHLVVLVLFTLRALYLLGGRTAPFLSSGWIAEMFNFPLAPAAGLVVTLTIGWSLIFWAAGIAFANRPRTHLAVASRFDIGIGSFFFLFVMEAAIGIPSPVGAPALAAFFLFSITAIALARCQGEGQRDFLANYRATGLVLGFALAVLLVGAAVALLLLPSLTLIAEAGYTVLRETARPILPVLLNLLRLIYGIGGRRAIMDSTDSPATGEPLVGGETETAWWTELLGIIFARGLLGIMALVTLCFVLWGLYRLCRWLLTPTSGSKKASGRLSLGEALRLGLKVILSWLRKRLRALRLLWRRSKHVYHGEGARLYARLLKWGNASGIAKHPAETPREYGKRLQDRFPELAPEIGLIVEGFNREIYGELTMSGSNKKSAREAWQKLHRSSLRFSLQSLLQFDYLY